MFIFLLKIIFSTSSAFSGNSLIIHESNAIVELINRTWIGSVGTAM